MKRLLNVFAAFAPFVILSAAVFFFLVQPMEEKGKRLEGRKGALQSEQTKLQIKLSQLVDQPEGLAFPSELLWIAATKIDGELALQRRIIGLAEAANVSLQRFGPVSVKLPSERSVIAFDLEAETKLSSLTAYLASLEALQPRIAILQLRIRHAPSRADTNGSTMVYFRMRLWGYWLAES